MDNPSPLDGRAASFPKGEALGGPSRPGFPGPGDVFDVLSLVRDPEHPYTLAELGVVHEDNIRVYRSLGCHGNPGADVIRVQFTPTVPHCSLAQIIALCLRGKVGENFPQCKVELVLTPGSHVSEADINKQINDKERVCAAMENEGITSLIDTCCKDTY